MKSQVLYAVLCNIPGEAVGEIWHWSLLGVKGLKPHTPSSDTKKFVISTNQISVFYLESKEVFGVIFAKHKFCSNVSVLEENVDLVSQLLECIEANGSTKNNQAKNELESKPP